MASKDPFFLDIAGAVRPRGRPRYSFQDNAKRWTGAEIKVEDCMDRKRWRAIVATAAKQYGT